MILAHVPLLGALCVSAGLVAKEAVETCLTLQQTIYPGTPIGQILVMQGYLTQEQLARMVAQQQNFRRTFCTEMDDRFAAPAAKTDTSAPSALPELGAFTAAEVDNNPLFGATE